MSSRRHRPINLPAPYLKRIWLDPARVTDPAAYPFCLPFLQTEFELSFERSITIIVGENGTGKSTLLEGIAVLAGYDEAGGGKGYMPVDHSKALEKMGESCRRRCVRVGCRKSPMAGSSGPRVFSLSRDIRMRSISKTSPMFPPGDRLISSRIPTAKASCVSSRSAVSARASSSSTSRNRRCHRHGRSNS